MGGGGGLKFIVSYDPHPIATPSPSPPPPNHRPSLVVPSDLLSRKTSKTFFLSMGTNKGERENIKEYESPSSHNIRHCKTTHSYDWIYQNCQIKVDCWVSINWAIFLWDSKLFPAEWERELAQTTLQGSKCFLWYSLEDTNICFQLISAQFNIFCGSKRTHCHNQSHFTEHTDWGLRFTFNSLDYKVQDQRCNTRVTCSFGQSPHDLTDLFTVIKAV